VHPKPDLRAPREVYRYFPGAAQVPESVAVNVRNRSRALIVDVTIPGTGPTDGVQFAFTKDEGMGGTGVLSCDGHEVGRAAIPRFTPSGFNGVGAGLTCGYEWGPAVGTGYTAPFEFQGTIRRAQVQTRAPVVRDPLAELEAILSEQ
jgi:hypothetical protein